MTSPTGFTHHIRQRVRKIVRVALVGPLINRDNLYAHIGSRYCVINNDNNIAGRDRRSNDEGDDDDGLKPAPDNT